MSLQRVTPELKVMQTMIGGSPIVLAESLAEYVAR